MSPLNATVPRPCPVVVSVKVTKPLGAIGVPWLGEATATVAVNVTGWPTSESAGETGCYFWS